MKKISLILFLLLIFIQNAESQEITIKENGLAIITNETGQFENNNLTSKTGNEWQFTLEEKYYENLDLSIILPKTSILKNIDSNLDYSITYNNGIRINFKAANQTTRITLEYSFTITKENSYSALIIFLLLLPSIVLIIMLVKKRKESENNILKLLSEKERQVYLTIKELGGEAKQSKIRRVTGLPKATLSRTIKKLEEKNILIKQGEGMLSKIILK